MARAAAAPALSQRETIDAWEAAVLASGLPAARTSGRPRVALGAPLAVGMAAERERIDIVLTDRLSRWQTREALEPHLPVGWSLVELEDVWLGGPALAGIVIAADYRITLAGGPDPTALGDAAAWLLDQSTLPREREKAGSVVVYDLRPLLADVSVVGYSPPVVLQTRTRFHASLGTGRPEEVVAALADRLGQALVIDMIVRERVLLSGDPDRAAV